MKVYAAWNKNNEIRQHSTSGGVFSVIAQYIIENNGYVCGAVMDYSKETPVVRHIISNDLNDLEKMRGSKYVQSDMGNTYKDIKELLSKDKYVLFSGTPCQVSGLKSFLEKTNTNYDKLLCIDILCHGVSSPLIFNEYCKNQQEKFNSKIIDINFRYKKPNWTIFSMFIEFENGKKYIEDKFNDPFLIGFLNDMYPREICSKCPFTSLDREGDITLSDFWGYKSNSYKMRNNEKGINVLLLNTKKGEEVFSKINDMLVYEEHPVEDILRANRSFYKPWDKNAKSNLFWNDFFSLGWDSASKKYCLPSKLGIKSRINFLLYQYWYLIPKFIITLRNKSK